MKKRNIATRYDGSVYTHRVLMGSADWFLRKAETERRGSYHSALGAMLFSWLAFEAYLNTLVEHLDPKIFADERRFFTNRSGFPGVLGKLRWVMSRLGAKHSRESERQRRVVVQLKRLRDQLAHAKPVRYSGVTYHSDDEEPPFMEDRWIERQASVARARRSIASVYGLSEWLHLQVRPRLVDPHLRRAAFNGVSQSQTASSSKRAP